MEVGSIERARAATLDELASRIISCRLCPRLVDHREQAARQKRAAFREETYWGRPVPGFGDPSARILLVGLAPAAHGSNRTGRMFTGDGAGGAGTTLVAALHRAGLANRSESEQSNDGLTLNGAYLTSVVHCAPPGNRPRSDEIANCLPYLQKELELLPSVRAIVALGQVAFDGCLQATGVGKTSSRPRFTHAATMTLPDGRLLLASYHPSRQNTQTGRLRPQMLDSILNAALTLNS